MRKALTILLLAAAVSPTARAQESLAPFDAPLVAFSDNTSVVTTGDLNGDGIPDAVGWWWVHTDMLQLVVRGFLGDGLGGFAQRWQTQYSNSSGTLMKWELKTGRLNADNCDDLAFALEDRVMLFTSTVQGTRLTFDSWTESFDVTGLVLADFNNDGLDDVAVSGAGVRLYLNNGSQMVFASSVPTGILLYPAELDGNGQMDLFCTSGDSIQVLTVVNGVITPGATYSHGITAFNEPMIVSGDVDGDLDDDIVVFSKLGQYVTIRQTTPGSFNVEALAQGGPATGLADIDGDGDLDGVCCGGGGGPTPSTNNIPSIFHVSMNDGDGNFQTAYQIPSLGGLRLAGAVDVDLDGDLDLVAGRSILFNRNTFVQDPQPVIWMNMRDEPIELTDVDGDGDPDYVPWYGPDYRSDGSGSFRSHSPNLPTPPAGTIYRGPGYRGDYDGDGDQDLIVGHTQYLTFLGLMFIENNGGGGYTARGYASAPGTDFGSHDFYSYGGYALLADVDKDGDQDLIKGNRTGLIVNRVWHNDGTGFFTLGAQFFAGPPVLARDLDGDGNLDLLGAYPGTSMVVNYGAGDGTFGNPVTLSSTFYPDEDHAAVADLNDDGLLDIAVVDNSSQGQLDLWFNNGNRTFTLSSLDVLGSGTSYFDPKRVFAMDVNQDGHQDLLVLPGNEGGRTTRILFGDGLGGFPEMTKQVFDPRGLHDVDADGDLDVIGPKVVRNAASLEPENGQRTQYGQGRTGLGGLFPMLGASGTLRVGETPSLRISSAPGGALALLMLGADRASIPDSPKPGMTLYVDPVVFSLLVPLGGQPGQPGAGRVSLPFAAAPALAGRSFYFQAWVRDTSVSGNLTSTNGLELRLD